MSQAQFVQSRSDITATYSLIVEERELYRALVPFNFAGYKAELFDNEQLLYTIVWDSASNLKNVGKKPTDKEMAFYSIIGQKGDNCGRICRKRNKTFNGYFFFDMDFNDTSYQMYEVGLGKQGIKLPVYRNGAQIALVEKENVTYNNNEQYYIHYEDDCGLIVSTLFTLYYDYLRFGHHGEISVSSKKTFLLFSTNKELRGKFNPRWEPCN